jgi:hypothetical protein
VRQRVPLILSTTALVVTLLGSTPLGHAAGKLVQTVPPFAKRAEFAKYAGTADNAKLLAGHKARATPAPGVIPVTGADGKIPTSFGTVGPQGPAGAQGPKGDSATKLWAHVDSNGSLLASNGVSTVTHPSAGIFRVTFKRDLKDCATLVGSDDGYYHVGGYPHESTVDIQVRAPSNSFTDIPFAIAVFC